MFLNYHSTSHVTFKHVIPNSYFIEVKTTRVNIKGNVNEMQTENQSDSQSV